MKHLLILILQIFLLTDASGQETERAKLVKEMADQATKAFVKAETESQVRAISKYLVKFINGMDALTEEEKNRVKTTIEAGAESRSKDFKLTEEDSDIGASKIRQIGIWRIRMGRLRPAAKIYFPGVESYDEFAWATQTVQTEWTLGIRCGDVKKQEGETREGPVMYLHGPKQLKPGQTVNVRYSVGKGWTTQACRVLKDGTINVSMLVHRNMTGTPSIFFQFGERRLEFSLDDFNMVSETVYNLGWDDSVPPDEPEPPKLPR